MATMTEILEQTDGMHRFTVLALSQMARNPR